MDKTSDYRVPVFCLTLKLELKESRRYCGIPPGAKHTQTFANIIVYLNILQDVIFQELCLLETVLLIRNDLFRVRIQLRIFKVPDPDPTHII